MMHPGPEYHPLGNVVSDGFWRVLALFNLRIHPLINQFIHSFDLYLLNVSCGLALLQVMGVSSEQ
jgi:hypothetical protein